MKNALSIICALCLFTFMSCDDDNTMLTETTDMQVTFKANYNGQTFMTEKEYDYNGATIIFNKLDFYLSDLVLTKGPANGGGESELTEIEFVDLTFNTNQQTLAEQGVQFTFNDIDVGEYSGVRLGVGVSADLNSNSWTDYASGHPLRNDTHYWASWESFIFAKLEGKIDMDNDGTFEGSFVYHTGSDEVYTEKDISEPITLENNKTKNITLNINVKELLRSSSSTCDANADGFLDVENADCNRTHSLSLLPLAKTIMGNYKTAITMN